MLFAGCGGQQPTSDSGVQTQSGQATATASATPETPAQESQPAAVVEEPAAASEQAEGALTAETLVGTKWRAGPYTLEFKANGVLVLNNDKEGTWSVEGNSLKVAAGDTSYTAEIRGDKLFYGGMPLTRIN